MKYRSALGNDVEGEDFGYKLHIIYGCMAAPSEKALTPLIMTRKAITFSWELSTTPVNVTDYKPTASLTIDSTKVDKDKLKALEKILYGSDAGPSGTPTAVPARLPLPDEIATLMGTVAG